MSTTTRTARIACARSMPSSYVGIVEVAELAHEPLGVERPALGVAGRARERALVPAQGVGEVPHLRDLQVMAGDAFVVADRHLAPQREARLAERRVPGASRSARSPRTGPCSTSRRRRRAARSSPRPAARARGCRSACRRARRPWCRAAPGSSAGTRRRPRWRGSGRTRGARSPRRRWRRGGSARRPRASRARSGRAPPTPRRTSRRGRDRCR